MSADEIEFEFCPGRWLHQRIAIHAAWWGVTPEDYVRAAIEDGLARREIADKQAQAARDYSLLPSVYRR